jgi:hypothetical protein
MKPSKAEVGKLRKRQIDGCQEDKCEKDRDPDQYLCSHQFLYKNDI